MKGKSLVVLFASLLIGAVSLSGVAMADNLQNITITTLKDLVIRQNQTDNTYSLDLLFFGNNFNNITQPFKFKITNSTNNISYNYSNSNCGSSFTTWNTNNSFLGKHFFQCVFSITQNLSIGRYNITVEANDTLGNSYSPYAEFVVTPKATVETFQTQYSTESLISSFDSKITNTSIVFKTKSFASNMPISIALYDKNPDVPAYDPFNTSQFVEIVPGWTSVEFYGGKALEWAEIRINYDLTNILKLGLDVNSLKLQSYNEVKKIWETCSGSSVNLTGKYVYCNSTHFSTWGITGDPIPVPTSQSSSGSSGSSGGGGSYVNVPTKNVTTQTPNKTIINQVLDCSKVNLPAGSNCSENGVTIPIQFQDKPVYISQPQPVISDYIWAVIGIVAVVGGFVGYLSGRRIKK